jgi:S-adenosylmethionine/arginine decarboxylase-like enzyme
VIIETKAKKNMKSNKRAGAERSGGVSGQDHGTFKSPKITLLGVSLALGVPLLAATGVAFIGLSFGIGQVTHAYWLPHQHDEQRKKAVSQTGAATMKQQNRGFVTTTIVRSRKEAEAENEDEMLGGEIQDEEQKDDDDAGTALPPGIGQHMSVDFRDVDAGFLHDEQRLAQAMVDLVGELMQQDDGENMRISPMQLIHHCHTKTAPFDAGVSCAGVWIVDSDTNTGRISFHTWPKLGFLTLDVFAVSGDEDHEGLQLLETIPPILERIFAIRQKDDDGVYGAPVAMDWAHLYRGFNQAWDANPDVAAPLARAKDLGIVLAGMDFSLKQVVSCVLCRLVKHDCHYIISTSITNNPPPSCLSPIRSRQCKHLCSKLTLLTQLIQENKVLLGIESLWKKANTHTSQDIPSCTHPTVLCSWMEWCSPPLREMKRTTRDLSIQECWLMSIPNVLPLLEAGKVPL